MKSIGFTGFLHCCSVEFTSGPALDECRRRSRNKLIAQTRDSDDHRRLLGIFFQLLPQAPDVYVHGACESFFTVSPNFFKQNFAGESGSRILRKVTPQAE